MKRTQQILGVFLAGFSILLLSNTAVYAQETGVADKQRVLGSDNPGAVMLSMEQEDVDRVLSSLSPAESDALLKKLLSERSRPDTADTLLQNLIDDQQNTQTEVIDFSKKVEQFTITTDDTTEVKFEYLDVKNRSSLLTLAMQMTDSRDYPVVVFKKAVFVPGMEIMRTLDLQIQNYQHRDEQWRTLDAISKAKYAQLENIVDLQSQRVENYKAANEQLNVQIENLSNQLTASVELTEKSIRGRNIKNLWIGALGGVFGFSVGVLIASL